MPNERRLSFSATALIGLVLLTGCATHYELVHAKVTTGINTSMAPTVSVSPLLKDRLPKYVKVVVSHPDRFAAETASAHQGVEGSSVLLQEQAAIWITEIERQFLDRGFTVLSRQKFQELMREKQVTSSTEAASLLGADMIVQINSLEYNPSIPLGQRTRVDLQYFRSDYKGHAIEPIELPEYLSRYRSEEVMACLKTDFIPFAQMAVLDGKVIDAATGEIVFFYRNQKFSLPPGVPAELSRDFLYLVKERPFSGHLECLVQPYSEASTAATSGSQSRGSVTLFTGREQQLDSGALARARMIESVCRDFLDRFLSVGKTTAAPK